MSRILKKLPVVWQPHEGGQVTFATCPAWECLLHGNRGGGKTDSLLMDFAKGVGRGYGADYRGLLLREATTELGDVIAKSEKWFPRMFPGAKYNAHKKIWKFKDGEVLWFNYARVIADYDQYHGHEYSISACNYVLLANGSTIQAKNVKVGDFLRTLQGIKKVTKVLKYKKPAIEVSVLDADSGLIGKQHQGIIHPVLTNDGWQRIGLSYLFQSSEQSVIVEHLLKEVSQFLHGIHQEILEVLHLSSSGNFYTISVSMPKWYSCLYQIASQFVHSIIHHSSFSESHLYELLKNHEAFHYRKVFGTFVEELKHEYPKSVQLFRYCLFLINLIHEIQTTHVHLLQSTLYHSTCLQSQILHSVQLCQDVLQFLNEKDSYQGIVSEFDLLVRNQTVLNDISSCVQTLIYRELSYLDDYFHGHNRDGELPLQVLGICQSSFPSQNDALVQSSLEYTKMGDQGISLVHNHSSCDSFSYTHPYTHESCETNLPLKSFSFSLSSCNSPIEMVDFEVESDNHYISLLTNIDNEHNQQLFLVNQNCWIGWEELTNHAVPDVYLKLMSCSRSSNPNIIPRIRATCNPSGPGHAWVKLRFIDAVQQGRMLREPIEVEYFDRESGKDIKETLIITRTHVYADMMDNKALITADPLYRAKMMQNTQDNEMLRKAWIMGSWDLIIGGFFVDVWRPKVHILPYFKMPKSWTCIRSFDWGSSSPWCVTFAVETNGEQPDPDENPGVVLPYFPKDSIIVIAELYGWNGKPNEGDRADSTEIAQRIKEVEEAIKVEYGFKVQPGPADTQIFDVKDGTSTASIMGRYPLSIYWTRAHKGSGSRVTGWALMRKMLGAAIRKDGENPHLYFFAQASHHIRTLPLMQRNEKKPEDIDSDLEDHAMDSLRYLIGRKSVKLTRKGVGI